MRAWSQNKSLMYFSVSNGPGGSAICDAFGGARTLSAHDNIFCLTSRPGLNRLACDRSALAVSSFTSLLIMFFNCKNRFRILKLLLTRYWSGLVFTYLRWQLERMPIIFDVWIDDIRQVVVATRMMQRQIEHQQVNDIFDGHMQPSQKLNAMIAIWAGKQIESENGKSFKVIESNRIKLIKLRVKHIPVTKIQWVIQAFDTFGVEPLLTASALKHLHIPFAFFAAIAIRLLLVLSMMCVPC